MSLMDKAEIAKEFDIDVSLLNDADIIVAWYDIDGYEGYAYVLYEQNHTLYEVNGSHCSCYGLEGQWKPEETIIEAVDKRFYDGKFVYDDHANKIIKGEISKRFVY